MKAKKEETIEVPVIEEAKIVVEGKETVQLGKEVTEEDIAKEIPKQTVDVSGWNPKTEVGRKVKNGEIKDIDEVLDKGLRIMEPEIVEVLLPNCETDLLMVGQSKGKFGGGQKRVFKQTQKKTQEGNKPKFATYAVFGNKDGYVGIGYGKSKETVPAREKALRNAKLNVIKIRRGCGSWECGCKEPHTIPFAVEGRCSSVRIKLMPAPKGTGLIVEQECQKIMRFAGISDVWSKTSGQTSTKTNLIMACFEALRKLETTKVKSDLIEKLGIVEGKIKRQEIIPEPEAIVEAAEVKKPKKAKKE